MIPKNREWIERLNKLQQGVAENFFGRPNDGKRGHISGNDDLLGYEPD